MAGNLLALAGRVRTIGDENSFNLTGTASHVGDTEL
jgi:hypothetical protein